MELIVDSLACVTYYKMVFRQFPSSLSRQASWARYVLPKIDAKYEKT